MTPQIEELVERLERGERTNELDVLIEVARFTPEDDFIACRANSAGTKVIYTREGGKQATCWARPWSGDQHRERSIAILKAKPTPSAPSVGGGDE